jgi:hypothetical protein
LTDSWVCWESVGVRQGSNEIPSDSKKSIGDYIGLNLESSSNQLSKFGY